MTLDSWELLGTPSTDAEPGLQYFLSVADVGGVPPAEPDFVLYAARFKGLPQFEKSNPKNFEVRLVAVDYAGHLSAPATFSVREAKSNAWFFGALFAVSIVTGFVLRLRRAPR